MLAIAPEETDRDAIKAAVIQRSAYVRNFQTGKHAEDATRILNELAAAEACLTTPAKRAAYDAELKKRQPAAQQGPAAAPTPQFEPLLEQAAASAMNAPWSSPLGQYPVQRRGMPAWQLAAAAGGGAVALLLIVMVLLNLGDDGPEVAANPPVVEAAPEQATDVENPPAPATSTNKTDPENSQSPAGAPATDTPTVDPVVPETTAAETAPAASTELATTAPPATDAPGATDAPPAEEPVVPPVEAATVFLTDLRPFDILAMDPNTGAMLSDEGESFRQLFTPGWAGSAANEHPITMCPPRPGTISSHVAFALDGAYRRFLGAAGISDTLSVPRTVTPLTFRVVGDGRELWRSTPLQDRGAKETFDIDVADVARLHLLVDCPGSEAGAWSTWIGTRLVAAESLSGSAATGVGAGSSNSHPDDLMQRQPIDVVTRDPFTTEALRANGKGPRHLVDTLWAGSLPAEQAIWLAPLPGKKAGRLVFALRKLGGRFTGTAAISDLTMGAATPVVFRVLGDSRELWRSAPLQQRGAGEAFDIRVAGISRLELRTECDGPENGAWAVWLDPRISPAE